MAREASTYRAARRRAVKADKRVWRLLPRVMGALNLKIDAFQSVVMPKVTWPNGKHNAPVVLHGTFGTRYGTVTVSV